MKQPSITVVIQASTYTLRSDDPAGMRDMPSEHREHLIRLLDVLRVQHEASRRRVQAAMTGAVSPAARSDSGADREPLGKGDVDELMARLVLEERSRKKPGIKPATIYKFAAVIIAIIVLLSLF